MNLFRSLAGSLRIEATSACVSDMLTAIHNTGVVLENVVAANELTIQATITRKDFLQLRELLLRRGEQLKVTNKQGIFWSLSTIHKRPILIIGLGILFLLSLFLPTRILFVKVEGNHAVSAQSILDTAQPHGIFFGAQRAKVRSEAIKNALLSEIPNFNGQA